MLGHCGKNMFFDFHWPLLGPISDHIGPMFTISGTNKSEHVYVSMIWLSICQCCQLLFHPFLRPICPYIFVLTYFSGYRVSMDQISMAFCGPDIHGYLWTRYLWLSVDQLPMGICGPGIYGPGTKVSRYQGTKVPRCLENFVRIYFAIAKTVAICLIAVPVPLFCSKGTFGDSWSFLGIAQALAELLIAIPVPLFC